MSKPSQDEEVMMSGLNCELSTNFTPSAKLGQKSYSLTVGSLNAENSGDRLAIFAEQENGMKVLKFHPPVINPIYRDLIIVLVAGLLASVALVTMGFMVIAQFGSL